MAGGSSHPLYGTPPPTKTGRPPKGRTCEHAGCTTVLSTYNASPTCWLHTTGEYRHALARG